LFIYWLLFVYFAAGALTSPLNSAFAPVPHTGLAPDEQAGRRRSEFRLFLVIGTLFMICMVGLRYKVGADWRTYELIFANTAGYDFFSVLRHGDPAYEALNWLVCQAGGRVWAVNSICAVIFGWGLFRLCSVQPLPWLALAIAVPYMIIVVAMGYTRQAVALGVLMAGLANQVSGKSILNFAVYTAIAATFHATAVIMFPLVAISGKGDRVANFLTAVAVALLLYNLFLTDRVDAFISSYLESEYSSQGAFIRVSMNMVAAVAFWAFGKRLRFSEHERKIWRNFSWAALVMLALLYLLSSTTAVDRISLYIMPLQIVVLTRVAAVAQNRIAATGAILAYLFTVQYVWLNYALHAKFWVPYHLYPF
jgi:hypothetical protein